MSDTADTELPRWAPSYPPPAPFSSIPSSSSASSSPYLSRSASFSTAATPRRHRQPGDLEASQSMQQSPTQFYSSSNAYHSPSMPQNSLSSPTSASADPYSDMSRSGRSPLRGPPANSSGPLLDPYSPQQSSQYSPTVNAAYPYASASDQRSHLPSQSNYTSHSRSHSQVKNEPMSPPISSPYSPQTPLHPGSVYSPASYAMDTSSPGIPQSQSHLTPHPIIRKNSVSQPPTPLSSSYMNQSHSPSSYYPGSQDQNMMVDPPQRRRTSGFRRVRDARDIQPRLDVSQTGRRMNSDGNYISPLQQVSTNLVDTYHICNPQFRYESTHNPRRVLTKPSKPAHNEGYDNDDYDYILYVNDWLGTEEGHKYLILDILGQGTFGQVVKCQNMKTHEIVAVKVVKNKPAYFNQSMMEVTILELLNKQCDPNDEHHILRLRDSFIHRNHLCLVFELLSSNLYELIKQNQFQGLSTQLVKVFMAQLLDAMTILKDARLIHCDLKPENILLKTLQSPQIKVIDFGSACHERQTVYTYIQSRFYRSPEVLLGMSYNAAIDVWSLGCIAVELFLGLPLFPGTSEYNQLSRIVDMLGLPPNSMLNIGKQTAQFFDSYDSFNPHTNQPEKKYRLKSLEQYSREHGTNEQPGKQYFKATSLPDIVNTAPMPQSKSGSRTAHEIEKEMNNRASFIDFCQGLLDLNPITRWTPQQARLHPFITGEKFTKPFVPDTLTQGQQAAAAAVASSSSPNPKQPFGGLLPSQPKGTRAYQDGASYDQHLRQHQAYTAQAQNQAANTFRNPYLNQAQQQSQQPQPQSQPPPPPQAQPQPPIPPYPSQTEPPHSFPQAQPYGSGNSQQSGTPQHHRLTHQNSAGHLNSSVSAGNYSNHVPLNSSLNPNVPSTSYYPNQRTRANTINQMDAVPPALARLQHMNQDVIAGRNALTPVLNRDDAMKEWERRQSGKPAAAQPYPQLEYLQQQAELAASGLSSWNAAGSRYPPPPSKLAHSYNATSMEEENTSRRDAVMSNVRSAARGDGNGAALYGSVGIPPQTYSSTSTTGNRYAMTYAQPPPTQQHGQSNSSNVFDSVDRRTDIGNMYVPMQPEGYQSYSGSQSSSSSAAAAAAARQIAPPSQTIPPSFYGAGVVPQGPTNQHRNPFSQNESSPPMSNNKDSRRGSNGLEAWPR